MAPDSEAQADTHPIGCGPFKFVKWERHALTLLERFENYFETDAQDNGAGLPDNVRDGVGLRVTRERLHAMYRGAGALTVRRRSGGGTVATIELPFATIMPLASPAL